MNFAEKYKEKLFSCIDEVEQDRELCFYNPKKDFVRKRKLPFSSIIKCFLAMEGSSVQKELLKYTDYDSEAASDSAFCQQRSKIRPQAFISIFKTFTQSLPRDNTYKGYFLLACDGSNLCTSINSNDKKYMPQGGSSNSKCKYLHLNALYDIQNGIYTAIDVEPARNSNEKAALIRMLYEQPQDQKTIYIADRGYESYNLIAHIDSLKQKFLIRIKDNHSGGFLKFFSQPDSEEYDEEYTRKFTRKSARKYTCMNETHIPIRHQYQQMDFFTEEHEGYEIHFRLIRFSLKGGGYECLITNLSKEEFTTEEIKEIYRLRWTIETSFSRLKYTVGLNYFHGKKEEFVLQEIYSRIIMFNFGQAISQHITKKKDDKKWTYSANFKRAVSICRGLITKNITTKEIAKLLGKNMNPSRPDRSYERKQYLRSTNFRPYSI